MTKQLVAAIFGLSVALTAHAALADCTGALLNSTSVSPALKDTAPFYAGTYTGLSTISLGGGVSACSTYLYVGKPTPVGTPLPAGALDINLSGGGLVISTDSASVIPVQASATAITTTMPLNLQAAYRKDSAPSTAVPTGFYTYAVPLELRDATGTTTYATGSRAVTIEIPSQAHITTVAGATATYNTGSPSVVVDFNTMASNATRDFYLNVRSTNMYTVTAASDNGFALLRAGAAATVENTVNYTLTYAGNNFTTTVPLGATLATDATGVTHTISATLGTVSNKRAGTYNDRVVFTVAAP